MSGIFKGNEIVDMAVRIEQNGFRFYTAVLENVKSDEAKEIFKYLADQEKLHQATFTKMLEEIGEYHPAPVWEDEYEDYMKSLTDSHVFLSDESLEEMAAAASDINKAIEIGIGFEKDSILFFMEMRNYVPETQKRIIQRLVDEEKKHLVKLQSMKNRGVK